MCVFIQSPITFVLSIFLQIIIIRQITFVMHEDHQMRRNISFVPREFPMICDRSLPHDGNLCKLSYVEFTQNDTSTYNQSTEISVGLGEVFMWFYKRERCCRRQPIETFNELGTQRDINGFCSYIL